MVSGRGTEVRERARFGGATDRTTDSQFSTHVLPARRRRPAAELRTERNPEPFHF